VAPGEKIVLGSKKCQGTTLQAAEKLTIAPRFARFVTGTTLVVPQLP
jgi:hypothetical protein